MSFETSTALPLESPEALVDGQLGPRSGAYFPRRLLTDFFDFALQSPDFEFITYDDLAWGTDIDHENGYPAERKRWQEQLSSGERDPDKAYILLQYDVDSRPERTLSLLREPSHACVPANVMIFNLRVDRRALKNTGKLGFTDYAIDHAYLKECQNRGCVIGYHTNAYEQSEFDENRALDIFDRDAAALAETFDLKYFSAHGGVAGPNGKNNRDLPFHPKWRQRLKWVHNGCSPHFDRHFSDGGHNSPKRDPLDRDIRDFVRTIRPGDRCRMLLHPQYYDSNPVMSPRFRDTDWYRKLLEAHRSGTKDSLWNDVKLATLPAPGRRHLRKHLSRRIKAGVASLQSFLKT